MIEERDWYGKDWKNLRTNLLKLCLLYGEKFLADLSHSPSFINLVDEFVKEIEKDILSRISRDNLGLWQMALPLLSNKKLLLDWLEKDKLVLIGNKLNDGNPVKPLQALGRKLCQYFEQERRQLVAAGYGVSPNRIKTWERLDRISREFASKNNTKQRCSEEHFTELSKHVKAEFPHDKNLPRKINTIQDYFYQFSADCYENIENQDYSMDKISMLEAKTLLGKVGMAQLSQCLGRLSTDEMEIVDVAFQLGIGKVQYLSLKDFLDKRSLTPDEYELKKREVLEKLRFFLECGLQQNLGGSENEY